jgi:glycogen debranching enzyme
VSRKRESLTEHKARAHPKGAASAPPEQRGFDLLPEAEPMGVQDIRDSLVIRNRDIFLLTDPSGQSPRGNTNGYGLYHRDTRYLSGYELSFSTARPLLLLSTAELGYGSEQVMTNPSMVDADGVRVPRGTLQLRRLRVIEDVLEETLEVVNHNLFSVSLEIVLRLSAGFEDIFEVRGYEPELRGQVMGPDYDDGVLIIRYKYADGHVRELAARFDPQPDSVVADADLAFVAYRPSIGPQEATSWRLVISLDGRMEAPLGEERFGRVAASYRRWAQDGARLTSSNQFFDAVLRRSSDDLRMLWHQPAAGPGYVVAGTPWYDALFGRDGCIAGMQSLAFNQRIARDCLASLARRQGSAVDPWRDEEPGKILHELREGELTETAELPFSPYFGSIDSTPLFLLLAGEYYRWSGDSEFIDYLRPHLDASLGWIENYGDIDGDGYIEYEKRSVKGLVNQGWKDSWDSMVHQDGSLIPPPVALVEVQAYTYAALRRASELYAALGERALSRDFRGRAAELRVRFNRDFWLEDESCYSLAIGGDGSASRAVTSNGGHALWCGIAEHEKAQRTARRLLEEDIFSGWGIRTLSSHSPRFNPQGYHLGTVWPHDNSLALMGMKRYGMEPEANVLSSALFQAARSFEYYRLPELFGGDALSSHQTPVPYPVACRPQAWAAGAFMLITQAILGLCPDAANNTLYIVNPVLPPYLDRLRLEGLRVGRGEADLMYLRRGQATWVRVLATRGGLEVTSTREWPEELL